MKYFYIQSDELHQYLVLVFQSCGLSEEKSSIAADVLCYADTNGIDSHGVFNLSRIYVPELLSGKIKPDAIPELISDNACTALLDGKNGLGLVVSVQAMDIAIAKAKQFGVGVVTVCHSSHFGSAGFYASRAISEGMIGITMTNLGRQAIVRPPNGVSNMFGTNPLCMGAPTRELPHFLLDMSTTVVSTGKIRLAHLIGREIPSGWLVDELGKPITDPQSYDQGWGHLCFLGGQLDNGSYKGYGLAMLVDILCGILSGACIGTDNFNVNQTSEDYGIDKNIGHFFMAISIENFMPVDAFRERLDNMLNTLLSCPTKTSEEKVVYPGWLEYTTHQERDKNGIPICQPVYESLIELSIQFNIVPPSITSTVEEKILG